MTKRIAVTIYTYSKI